MTKKYLIIFVLLIFIILSGYFLCCNPSISIKQYVDLDRIPVIVPDYTNIIIPCNITALNFQINEAGNKYYVELYSENGDTIKIINNKPEIIIPLSKWKKLLSLNKGKNLYIEIYMQDQNGEWKHFKRIKNHIAIDEIDSHLVYRIIDPAYNVWNEMGIYQRDIQSFSEQPVLINKLTQGNCMNCHSFCNNNPDFMLLHLRLGAASGTLIRQKDKIVKVNTKTNFSKAGAYPSWHPSGRIITFSVNQLLLTYHTTGECREVLDVASDLIIYHIENNLITTTPEISSPDYMETFPAWSPDGKYLYFCRSEKIDTYYTGPDDKLGLMYDKILYDLMRIEYNPENGTWGEAETVIAANDIGLSITIPRISPDGRFLLFCAAQYGSFPIYLKSADIFLLDLHNGQYKRLNANSDDVDSYHSWSSNSRWFVFSSKRDDGIHAQPYFSYIDQEGNSYKPFILPQEDPKFYSTYLKTFNIPEFINKPIEIRSQKFAEVALGHTVQAHLDPLLDSKTEPEDNIPKWQKMPQ